MPAPTIRNAADPLDDIDREASGVDSAMARQDRADLPGERSDQPGRSNGDVYIEATRELSQQSLDPRADAPDAERDIDRARERLAPVDVGRGADDDDPIDETERAGDDSLR
jgi:hypothetical protein